MAAAQAHAGAQCNLGQLYYHGKSVSQDFAEAMRELRRFIESDADAHYYIGGSRCCYILHRACDRLGLDHESTDERYEITRERYVETRLKVSKPSGWSMEGRSLDDAREDLNPTPHDAPRPLRKRYECECCGKGDDEAQLALTRRWGLACVDCIDDGSMSEMVGEDITAYKIEDVPRGYYQRGVTPFANGY